MHTKVISKQKACSQRSKNTEKTGSRGNGRNYLADYDGSVKRNRRGNELTTLEVISACKRSCLRNKDQDGANILYSRKSIITLSWRPAGPADSLLHSQKVRSKLFSQAF